MRDRVREREIEKERERDRVREGPSLMGNPSSETVIWESVRLAPFQPGILTFSQLSM